MFSTRSGSKGRVRIDLPVSLARTVVMPRLPELLAQHPQLELLVSTTDRRVDLLREGFDCVLRVGALADSSLIARRLGALEMMNCASPRYLEKYGTPRAVADLDQHLVVNYSLTFGSEPPSFEYFDGTGYREHEMRSVVTVNSTDAYEAACVAGLGIVQVPRMGMAAALAAGAVVKVLPDLCCAPLPVSIVQGHARQARGPVRVVMDWLEQLMAPHLAR